MSVRHAAAGTVAGPDQTESFTMDTRDLPPSIRFDTWRAFWEPALHVVPSREFAGGFRGRVRLRRLGRFVLLEVEADPAGYHRARSAWLRDGLDQWLVALRVAEAGGKPSELRLGSLSIGFGQRELDGRWCGVFIQPGRLPQLAPAFGTARAMPVESPAARMMGGMLPRIAAAADEIAPADAPRLEAALSSMLTACLMGWEMGPASTRQHLEAARRARVVALVDAALGDPDLSPAVLVERSGISRSELYRCFAPAGGIARVIQLRRLRHAYRELARSEGPASVSRIGEAVGFFDPSSFTRAFRREFGCTPSEVLARRQPRTTRHVPGLAAALNFC